MSLPHLTADYAETFPELVRPAAAAPATDPQLVILNEPLAAELGLDAQWLATDQGIAFLLGQQLPDSAQPVAQAYAGHQFGSYVPVLGDGRALLTGELTVNDKLVDIHLKGSGPTPFSRPGSDGFAGLGPMLREYLISESLHALGIATTRSLAVITTGGQIWRENRQPAAVLVRTGPSHLRVGTFQYARARQDLGLLQRLTDYSLRRHYPAVDAENPGLALLEQVVARQAELMASWMHLGLIHGVMNTDNMTIAGHSIDFGPVAMLNAFDPKAVFSSIDFAGRYAYGNQPVIAEWNLSRFAETLLPVIMQPDQTEVMSQEAAVEAATRAVVAFRTRYSQAWSDGLRARLGVTDGVDELGQDLLELMHTKSLDFTTFFAGLTDIAAAGTPPADVDQLMGQWYRRWLALGPDAELVAQHNPIYVPRNHLVEKALEDAVAGDDTYFSKLLAALLDPYHRRDGLEEFETPAPMEFALNYQTYCGT